MYFINLVRKLLNVNSLVKALYSNRSLFLVLSFPIKLIDILFVRPKNEILFYGYNGRYNGNSSSLYRYCLSKKNQLSPIWLLDKQDLNQFGNSKNCFLLPSKNSNILEHIKLLLKIAHARAVVVTSVGDLRLYCSLLYSKKRIEVLLPHGITIKSAGIMARHFNKNERKIWSTHPSRFDLVSVSSRVEQHWISSGFNLNPEKVKILGIQRGEYSSDNLKDEKNTRQLENFFTELGIDTSNINLSKATKVLYAPTHRDHLSSQYSTMLENIDGYNLQELNHFLKENNILLFLREHAISDKNTLDKDSALESNVIHFSPVKFPDIEQYFHHIDVIITDYSGIYLEHLMSKKSLAFALFDIDDFEINRGLNLPKEILFPGHIFKSQKEFVYYLKNRVSIDQSYINQRKYLHSLLFEKSSEGACRRTMVEIEKMINRFS